MEKVVQLYHQFLDLPNVTGFATIDDLKEFYSEKTAEREEFEEALESCRARLDEAKEDLAEDTGGMRNKLLGGRFGGNREAVEELKEVEANIVELVTMEENASAKHEEIDSLVFEQSALIIGNDDEEFATVCEYQSLMDEACSYSEEVLREIIEAIDALEEAVDAEELDQWTDSAWADMSSDFANQEAANEVNDVNNILIGYREFLDNIGESAIGLYGSDYDFNFGDMMSESFFGDFWGSEMQIERLDHARNQMLNLRESVSDLFGKFSDEYSSTMEQIQERIDAEWEKE
ncbi:hypothetical protein LCGC14_0921340 [marine sediment metagenome]|uniref:Uncharacterized protein n=1 Tax=marine sediment metagenome TaxID=412755 RepID=A0A0F9NQR1_9ZZZZ